MKVTLLILLSELQRWRHNIDSTNMVIAPMNYLIYLSGKGVLALKKKKEPGSIFLLRQVKQDPGICCQMSDPKLPNFGTYVWMIFQQFLSALLIRH